MSKRKKVPPLTAEHAEILRGLVAQKAEDVLRRWHNATDPAEKEHYLKWRGIYDAIYDAIPERGGALELAEEEENPGTEEDEE